MEAESKIRNSNFCLPNHWSVSSASHTMEVEKVRSSSQRYYAIQIKITSRESKKTLVNVALTLEEQIGFFAIASRMRPLTTPGSGLNIVREGKSLIFDTPRSTRKAALSIISSSAHINLQRTQCIILSGVVLSCIAQNLGVTDESARFLIQQWRDS